jgi:hypothetical protein
MFFNNNIGMFIPLQDKRSTDPNATIYTKDTLINMLQSQLASMGAQEIKNKEILEIISDTIEELRKEYGNLEQFNIPNFNKEPENETKIVPDKTSPLDPKRYTNENTKKSTS